ncbi:hypothetical protein [Aquibacillus kalidii]|uniref:hypothetical protein n=1 Tax=Aquibacillus kalidii TaxID=2762597 RepID=UPI001648A277|nr:hypothetical protein [Aquibacillus kalidii]
MSPWGWVISSIVVAILGTVFGMSIGSLNKQVVKDRYGKINFKKTDIYFKWTRWDHVIVIISIYTFLCITGLLVFLLRGDTINSIWVQFFIHQTFVFSLLTFCWSITRTSYILKGIKERWSDEFK